MSSTICDLYCRVSTSEQADEGFSLQEQERRLRSFADAHGWTVHDCLVDGGFSGAKLERPGIQRVIDDAKAHRINAVVTYRLDRLSRSQKDTLYLIEDVFLANEVNYVSMTESLDTGTAFGMAIIGILSVFAQLERETIKERMLIGRIAAIKDGKWRGGNGVPIGYRYIPKSADRDGELVVDPYEAELVRRTFAGFLAGKNYRALTAAANEYPLPGRPERRGTNFAQDCLSNRFYIGQTRVNGEWFPGRHEPIIDDETFGRVQAKMAEYAAQLESRLARPRQFGALLNGFAYCAKCGARIRHTRKVWTSSSGEPRETCRYDCGRHHGDRMRYGDGGGSCSFKRVPTDELETAIWDQISALRFEDLEISRSSSDLSSGASLLEKRIAEIGAQQSKLVDLYSIGSLPLDAVRKRSEDLSTERARLEAKLRELRDNAPTIDPEQIRTALASVREIRESGSLEEQRDLFRVLIDRILVWSDSNDVTVEIRWKF